MKAIQFKTERAIDYFRNKNWKVKETDKGYVFYKNGTIIPMTDQIVIPKIKEINGTFNDLYLKFNEITCDFFKSKLPQLDILEPKNIYNGYANNSFVSTGLEYYYDYLYKDASLEHSGTMIIQPSIRFKLDFFENKYGENDKYDYSSISFNNISIVGFFEEYDITQRIEDVLDYFSKLRIHASRVNFIIEKKIREKANDVSYFAIKFFVDNLEVGDILIFQTKRGYLIEYGFGFERLLSRIVNKKYRDLFIKDNQYDQTILLGVNFLTSLCMFDDSLKNRGAKSKTNEVVNAIKDHQDLTNIDLIYANYLYWKQILQNTCHQSNFDDISKRYLRLIRR